MNLEYAVERLYQTGWSTVGEWDLDQLPDGRAFPSLIAVQREFARAGLELSIKHNLIFNCYRATWRPPANRWMTSTPRTKSTAPSSATASARRRRIRWPNCARRRPPTGRPWRSGWLQ